MAGASDTNESSKYFLTTVEKCVECPVCLETVKVPFKQCSRGHIVCLSCITKISKCPTCEGPFTQENPVCVKNILEALPRRCIYSQDGCEEIVKSGNDHEEFCGYRPFVCRECFVKMTVVKLLDHYKEHHHGIITKTSVGGFKFLNLCKFNPVWLFDSLFWILLVLCKVKDTYIYKIFLLATPIGKLDHDYYVRVTIQNGDFLVVSTLKAIAWSSFENMEDTYDDIKEMETRFSHAIEKFCMTFPHRQIENWEFITKKYTEMKLFFFKTAKE